jgi:hypothetical protein
VTITEGTQPTPTHPTGTTTTSASFTPESGALLVALVAADGLSTAATTATVTDSLGGTWTLLKRVNAFSSVNAIGGTAEVWCRDSPGTSMTVTASGWASNAGDLTVRTLIGAKPAAQQPGATGASTTGATVPPTAILTPTQIGSRIYGAALDYTTNATLTANANTTSIDQFVDATNGDTWATFKASADTAALSSTTYGYTNANAAYNVAAVEILAATTAGSPASVAGSAPAAQRPTPAGSSLVLRSTAVSRDAQQPAVVVGAPPGRPGQQGSAVVLFSQAPSRDFQQPVDIIGVAVRPPATGSAQILASRAAPPPPTDTPPPALAASPIRPPRPAATAVVLASQAPSADAQPEPLIVVAGRWPVLPGSATIWGSRADPVVQTDSQPRPLVAAPLRPVGPGSSLIVSPVSPSLDAQPAPLLVRAGILPVRRGSALLTNSVAQPLPPTLTPVTVTSFTIPRLRPAAGVLLLRMASDFAVCTTARPFTGTTSRPGSGTTTYALATTARPNTGTTARPDTGTTEDPC